MTTIDIEDTLGITFCRRQQIAIESGAGCYVWDEGGNKYLDFTSGWGVTCLGHSHACILDAINRQASKLMQNPNSGFTYSPVRARLLSLLTNVLPLPLQKVYFANSGAEANDAAIKLARKISGKSKVISTTGSFHGRTFNTLSVSGGTDNTSRFLPSMAQTCFVPFGDIGSLREVVDSTTAAVIVEPVQGEGGVRVPEDEYLAQVSELCQQQGALLIVDEIQTGFCRTGKLFAMQHSKGQVLPDFLTMGKGIAGGFPFAGFAVSARVAAHIELGDHGGTYCGNPLGCAVAEAVVTYLIEHNVAAQVAANGELLLSGMRVLQKQFPSLVKSVRGRGLLCAMEMTSDVLVQELTQRCLQLGLLVTPTRNAVVRLIPSLLIDATEIQQGLARLHAALQEIRQVNRVEMD